MSGRGDAGPAPGSRDHRTTWSIGGGIVGSVAEPEFSEDINGQGAFVSGQMMLNNGVLGQFSLSATEDTESGPTTAELARVGVTTGYMFRRNSAVRPFVVGGLSFIGLRESVGGVDLINDNSQALVVGAGLLAGTGHHNFFLDFATDLGHEVEDAVGAGLEADFTLNEAHMGYAYRF